MVIIERVKEDVLKKIKPNAKEQSRVEEFCGKLAFIVSEFGYESVVVGSIGKHTWLNGDHDIDLFVLFPKTVPREELEKQGLELGKKIAERFTAKPVLKYAEHPYTYIKISNFRIDIVPCYKIEHGEKILSAVDRSPLHLRYVIETLRPEQRDEVRLLKQFLKGIGVYGSDVKHLGFSGYVAEILIIKFGLFEAVLKDAANWKIPQHIDIKDFNRIRGLPGPLFLIDPVDETRNAAAAISSENLIKFRIEARNFLKNPSMDFFFRKIVALSAKQSKQIVKRGSEFVSLLAKRPDIIEDTLFPQLRKATKRIEKLCGANEFRILKSIEYADDKVMMIVFEFESCKLPDVKQMIGPPIYDKTHTQEFLTKYSKPLFGPLILDDRWVAEINREFKTPHELIKNFLNQQVEKLMESGIPKFVAPEMKKAKILDDKKTWKIIKKNKKLSDFIRRRYFDRFVI